ncbi:SSURE domain-containing protein [Enterococcus alishanensis]|uniref:Fibronectin-binding SSURE repeat-containing protein n=1 Tax=Enterococcus alishanensis TaxID=1303817 RepID=A0ABS6TDH3_9ENTE|nr:fibronectin-binding SSURE repeat-containing protein [Enterococcus alishanensis]MBV7390976.1 fibronectin-binding SSURE repeat-containing protein [Enterococcus alishanensis]
MSNKNQSLLKKQTRALSKSKQKRIAASLVSLAVLGTSGLLAVAGQTKVQAATTSTTAASKAVTSSDVVKAVQDNIKTTAYVSKSDITAAEADGPFLAGVSSDINFAAFGGDGMLTRLLLNSSDGAAWSNNGSGSNSPLLPVEGLTEADGYTYQVKLTDPEFADKTTNQELLTALQETTATELNATVTVYQNNAQVATKKVQFKIGIPDIQSALDNTVKSEATLSVSDVTNGKGTDSPYTAGINSDLDFSAFGGDGMISRRLLKASDDAAWSDNGSAGTNAALLAASNFTAGQFTYNVSLSGVLAGKTGDELVQALQANPGKYTATVNVYASDNTSTPVATKTVALTVDESIQNSVSKNIKDTVTVSGEKVGAANFTGPFSAGVNQVIPFEAYGGDGMLTRLLINSTDEKWSDNGVDQNAAIAPAANLEADKYFYEVDLDGAAAGKTGEDLVKALQANPGKYTATTKVYAAGADGKADTSSVIATKTTTVNIEKAVYNGVKLYRAYNPNSGEHLYTVSKSEFDGVIKAGWTDEGTAWKTANEAVGTPVYRLYNKNSGEHFYTSSEAEYNSVANAGWNKEGVAFYSADKAEGVAVYRAFNPNAKGAGSHLFTTSVSEKDGIVSKGWKDEGIAFYGVK